MSLLNKIESKKLGRGVLVRGIGVNGAKCAYQMNRLGIRIIGYISDNSINPFFRNVPVYKSNDEITKHYYILIATNMDNYMVVSKEMQTNGKQEILDFCYYEWLYKELVLLHGNCHMEILKYFLSSSEEFSEKYSFYPFPFLVSSANDFNVNTEVFYSIDLWIHEDIRDDNMFGYKVSDSYIRKNISPDTKEIIVPHLYGVGKLLFPQSIFLNKGNESINDGIDTDGIFLYGDKVIEKCISEGMKIDEIISFCKSDNAFIREDIISNFEDCIDKIKEREKSWDIKISKFILDNYQRYKLFYDPGHPTNCIMKYIALMILKKLNIECDYVKCDKCMDAHEKPIYPMVKKVLKINFLDDNIRVTGKKLCEKMNFEEFIIEYCWWRHFDIIDSIMR